MVNFMLLCVIGMSWLNGMIYELYLNKVVTKKEQGVGNTEMIQEL